LDSVECAAQLSDDAFISWLFRDCAGREPTQEAARLRRIMLKVGFPRSRMRHDMLTTSQFRRRPSNAPFWIFYDLFVRTPLHPYQQLFLKKVKNLGVEGKLILEVGCSYGDICRPLAREPIKRIIGIDLVLTRDFYFDQLDTPASKDGFHEGEVIRKRYELREMDILKTDFKPEMFDLVISDATVEHIDGFDQALREVHRVLKPGGVFFARWGPIWSAVDGHHFFHWFKDLRVFGNREYQPLEIPPWGHLRMSKQELFDYIRKIKREEVAAFACERIYNAGFLNRLFPEEYVSIIKKSPFEVVKLERLNGPIPPPEILKALPRFSSEDLQTSGFEILLRK
jgi:SAM-dependent methyltransferase